MESRQDSYDYLNCADEVFDINLSNYSFPVGGDELNLESVIKLGCGHADFETLAFSNPVIFTKKSHIITKSIIRSTRNRL